MVHLVKYTLRRQKVFAHFEARQQRAVQEIKMYWYFPILYRPGYSGTIGIRGLVNNAVVKITEMNGRLVYQTKGSWWPGGLGW